MREYWGEMADFIFCIPSKLRDLLVDNGDYFVRNVVVPRDIQSEFKGMKSRLPNFLKSINREMLAFRAPEGSGALK